MGEIVTTGSVMDTGATIATLLSGKKAFVQGALPGETVEVEVLSEHSKYVNAVVTKVLEASVKRCVARDEGYLETSPWQIYSWDFENACKQQLIVDAFGLNKMSIDVPPITTAGPQWNYRNKYTYPFMSTGHSFGTIKRLGHEVVKQTKFSLPTTSVQAEADRVLNELADSSASSNDYKSLVVRSNAAGETVSQIIKTDGTKVLYTEQSMLTDQVLGKNFAYSIDSFFQINLPVYEKALLAMKQHLDEDAKLVDMYSGVGTIGISLAQPDQQLVLVEIDRANAKFAKTNIRSSGLKRTKSMCVRADAATEQITPGCELIVDPPRAGLSKNLCKAIMSKQPKTILYLSCNPFTQARDIVRLSSAYDILHIEGFNFFPKTPHIENLVVLKLKPTLSHVRV